MFYVKGFIKSMLHPISLIMMAVMVLISVLTGCGNSSNSAMSYQTTMVGSWHQVENGISGTTMSADITNAGIQINLKIDSTNDIFWLGTFDTRVKKTGSTTTIISLGDQDAMSGHIFKSSEQSKRFVYKNGTLSYQFSIMGTSTTVYLRKNSSSARRSLMTPAFPSYASPSVVRTPARIPAYRIKTPESTSK